MNLDPASALASSLRGASSARDAAAKQGTLIFAGATGPLGQELVRRLAGTHRFAHCVLLAREPIRDGLRGVESWQVPDPAVVPIEKWPLPRFRSLPSLAATAATAATAAPAASAVGAAQPPLTALVSFDPPRLFYDRERALWTPEPAQLAPLARWLHASGVRTLAVVQPHAQGRLPEALKRGLASLNEQAVAALGFECFILVRGAQKPASQRGLRAGRSARRMDALVAALHGPVQRATGARRESRRAGRSRIASCAARCSHRGAGNGLAGGAGKMQEVVGEWLGAGA